MNTERLSRNKQPNPKITLFEKLPNLLRSIGNAIQHPKGSDAPHCLIHAALKDKTSHTHVNPSSDDLLRCNHIHIGHRHVKKSRQSSVVDIHQFARQHTLEVNAVRGKLQLFPKRSVERRWQFRCDGGQRANGNILLIHTLAALDGVDEWALLQDGAVQLLKVIVVPLHNVLHLVGILSEVRADVAIVAQSSDRLHQTNPLCRQGRADGP